MTTYLLAGGGTAGHVNPLLAVADRLRQREPDATVLVLGTAEGLESRLVPARGYELLVVAKLPFPRSINRAALAFPARFRTALAVTRGYLKDRGVDVVVGFGGYAAAPAYIAARQLKIPLAVHEANARPGLANRLATVITPYIGTTFRSTRLRHSSFVGMPLRREIVELDRAAARREASSYFGLDRLRPTLLVTGGSSGARSINTTVAAAVSLILGTGWQVLHLTGERSQVADPHLPGYCMIRYCDRMDLALAITDLAISRAGAGAISELSALGIPAVYIPYPVGNGEQKFNARDAVDARAAVLLADADFTPEWVADVLVGLLADRAAIAEMAAHAASSAVRDGSDRMVDLILAARDSRADESIGVG